MPRYTNNAHVAGIRPFGGSFCFKGEQTEAETVQCREKTICHRIPVHVLLMPFSFGAGMSSENFFDAPPETVIGQDATILIADDANRPITSDCPKR